MSTAQLRKGTGFRKTCKQCGEVHLLKKLKCQCGYDFQVLRSERRLRELEKKVEQGKNNRKYNNSSRIIAKAKDTLALFSGFGYEAVFLYCTNSSKRPETQLLVHDGANGKAAQFAKSLQGEQYRNIFAGWIANAKETTGTNLLNNQPQQERSDDINEAMQTSTVSPKQTYTTNEQEHPSQGERQEAMNGAMQTSSVFKDATQHQTDVLSVGTSETRPIRELDQDIDNHAGRNEENGQVTGTSGESFAEYNEDNFEIDIADLEKETGVDFATFENIETSTDEDGKANEDVETGLQKGMKVEAEDTANKLVCCATILELKQEKIKIRFDGWGRKYDTWFELDSSEIHPVGWCQEMEVPLCPPKDWSDVDGFTWEEYLTETNSKPATSSEFRFEEKRRTKIRLARGKIGAAKKEKKKSRK